MNELFDSYIKFEINRKLSLKFDDLREILINLIPDNSQLILSIIKQHSYPVNTILCVEQEKKTRNKKSIDSELRCMARTGSDLQCLRPRLENTRYCQSHTYSLPYDDIESKSALFKGVKKRGRKGKGKVIETSELDLSKYIPAVVINIDDTNYLVDENDVIFNFNSNNEIVGYIKDEQVHWLQ